MLQTMKISKKEFDINMMNLILEVLQYKYAVIDKKPMWVLVSKSKEILKISQFSKRSSKEWLYLQRAPFGVLFFILSY